MLLQAEWFVKSLRKFDTESFVTIVITGDSPLPNYSLRNYSTNNDYLNNNAEILYCEMSHSLHPPIRWFVEPKSETCVLVDSDVLVCSPIQVPDPSMFHGVIAHKSPCNSEQWFSLYKNFDLNLELNYRSNYQNQSCPYYVNFGVLFVPKDSLLPIGNYLKENMNEIWKVLNRIGGDTYYVSQIVLSMALSKLNIKVNALPLRYNYPDTPTYDRSHKDEMENAIFYHYLSLKYKIYNNETLSMFLNSPNELENHKIPKRILHSIIKNKLFI